MGNILNGRWYKLGGRSAKKAEKNLGVISIGDSKNQLNNLPVRKKSLGILDQYYDSTQYDHLISWITAAAQKEYVPIRQRKPLIIYNLAKVAATRISGKLIGNKVFPTFKVEDDPDTEEYIRMIIKASKMKVVLMNAFKRMSVSGSVLVRFYFDNGGLKLEKYNSKWCYPVLSDNGDLEGVRIQYVYQDEKDLDESGNPTLKWFRLDLGQFSDISYDNPEYEPNGENPAFQVLEQIDHGLGFVQAEWFRTDENQFNPDGISLIADALDFFDEFNYSLSQSSQAVGYNQDPQLTVSGMDQDEVDNLIRSSQKGWNLGREGKAAFIETDLGSVERAIEMRDKSRLCIQDIVRVILLDPEKIVGHAQSAKAMEVLHQPMVDLIEELRPQIEGRIVSLIQKMMITNLILASQGAETPVVIPQGYQPKSLNIEINWPAVFQQTTQDLKEKIQMVSAATAANLISRETGLRKIAKDFDVENIEEELERINTQVQFNPFGSF